MIGPYDCYIKKACCVASLDILNTERYSKMRTCLKNLTVAAALIALCAASASAQVTSTTLAQRSQTPVGSIPLATATVADCISVEAVLLPKKPTAMLFSGYVSDNFAVVKTTISNHCSNQQFILHNIFFDYSDWALSGVYFIPKPCTASSTQPSAELSQSATRSTSNKPDTTQNLASPSPSTPTPASGNSPSPQSPCDTGVKSNSPGQVATVGALDVQEEVTQDSVFSKRNLVVNGLTLIGQVAGGYAFVGSTAAAQGIGAFNSAFVPNLAKFWPDRRLDQEKFLLALGYRTDQTTVVAKQDHGSYYAFFPISTFLTPSLKKLFLDEPAVFLNPAEAAFDSIGHQSRKTEESAGIRNLLLDMAQKIEPGVDWITLLTHLSAQCEQDKCPVCNSDPTCAEHILAEKTLFSKASLNSARIVVRGVMTIEVNSIPPTIDEVKFDNEQEGASLWKVSSVPAASVSAPADGAKQTATNQPQTTKGQQGGSTAPATSNGTTSDSIGVRTGVITGKFLSGGTPTIVAISVPGVENATQSDYIASGTLKAVPDHSSDSSLPFTLTLGKTQMPSGTKLTFQVSRTSPNVDSSSAQSPAGTSTTLTSNKYVYTVNYESSSSITPTISGISVQTSGTGTGWQTVGKLSGTVKGTNLTGGTVSVSSLEVNGTASAVADYLTRIAEVPKTSSATALDFQLTVVKALPAGSKISFVVSTAQGGNSLASQPFTYLVPSTKPTSQGSVSKPPKGATRKGSSVPGH